MLRSLPACALAAASAGALALAAAAPAGAATPLEPIPAAANGLIAQPFTGAPSTAGPLSTFRPPRHPFMAPNPNSNIHNDAFMTDTYLRPGPVGRDMRVGSYALSGLCGTITFDSRGRIVSVCISPDSSVRLHLIDPKTNTLVDRVDLPPRVLRPGANPFQDFTGGGYFYLDHRDRAVIPTNDRRIVTYRAGATGFVKGPEYDLRGVMGTDKIGSALPDWQGNIWFIGRQTGLVGVLNPRTRAVRTVTLGEAIGNSFAVGEKGVFVASDRRMYRFDLRRGRPVVTWRVRYDNIGTIKPGQVDAGTGTTPTLIGRDLVAITDNADPMQVVVYRRAARLPRGQRRTVCEVPVFDKGASATENSLISIGNAILVENNHGYTGGGSVVNGATTTPGVARVDVRPRGRGCRLRWTNRQVSFPSVVPKASARTGLMYGYAKRAGRPDAWWWTALDVRSGREVWSRLAGASTAALDGFNNNYAGLAVGPDRRLYLGVLGGIAWAQDG